jgi:mono/diheme cytochrome c family protein
MALLSLAVFAAALAAAPPPLPETLAQTGLYADAAGTRLHPEARSFSPQYPLWSDGAHKQRWLRLPAGGAIDARDPDAWVFPPGTRLWKQFSYGRPVETRYIERLPDGSWRFATYLWNPQGTEARLAPEFGATVAVEGAPGGRYAAPSRGDCLACHDTSGTPVLGVSALQLSPDRDPLAPHARAPAADDLDLDTLQRDGLLLNWPGGTPRIAARSADERAALGYLHGNCGHCHAAGGGSAAAVPVDLTLAWRASAPRAALDSLLQGRPRMAGASAYLQPGQADASLVLQRLRSRDPFTRMPPLGSGVPDDDALALISRWIDTLPELQDENAKSR